MLSVPIHYQDDPTKGAILHCVEYEIITVCFLQDALMAVQNIAFDVRALSTSSPLTDALKEARMLKLIGADVFVVSIQPAEKELQASKDDHAGPLIIEGEHTPPSSPAFASSKPLSFGPAAFRPYGLLKYLLEVL